METFSILAMHFFQSRNTFAANRVSKAKWDDCFIDYLTGLCIKEPCHEAARGNNK